MSVSSLILNTGDFCVLRGDIIDKILLSGNADAALLYLYMSRAKRKFEEKNAIKHLNFTKERYDRTVYELLSMQAIEKQAEKQTSISYTEKPKYTVNELKTSRSDQNFDSVCQMAEGVLGKVLTDGYLRSLLYIYDSLNLPAEVIVELLVYLKEKSKTVPKRADIEREAHLWVDMGIATYTDATNYIASKYAEKPVFDAMMSALKIYGRDPQPIEERYILSFINYGFSPDVIEVSVDRMHNSIGKFSFQYLNKILLRLKEEKLFTIEQIVAKDPDFVKPIKQNDKNKSPNTERTGALLDWEIELIKEHKGEL